MFSGIVAGLNTSEGRTKIDKVKALAELAGTLECTVAQLALAWLAVNPNTSSVIIGASSVKQLEENLGALDVLPKLTPDVLEKVKDILGNKPSGPVRTFFPLHLNVLAS
jgi:aryl-alcohol dehydrogenase-like predicted oxidoreductase